MTLLTEEDRENLREAMKNFDITAAMRLAFGKCPKCRTPLESGYWLEGCPKRSCQGYVGPKRSRGTLPPEPAQMSMEFDPSSVLTELEKTDA